MSPPRLDQPFVIDTVPGPHGGIPRVSSTLMQSDRFGSMKARWGVGRMEYAVDPGLYALGSPTETSPVLVTANYKMSFDRLREALPGRDTWILVLDTKGINVWCAAGKGTFGTDEMVRRIGASGLSEIVTHRRLVLPQLGAPGVAAHLVKKASGFSVHYGPIRAGDIPAYLDAGMKATPDMRRKSFTMAERAVLVPMELVEALKAALVIIPVLILIGGFGGSEGYLRNLLNRGAFPALAILGAILSGAVLTPLLLPYLPGRAFTTKGLISGVAMAMLVLALGSAELHTARGLVEAGAWTLMITAISAYLAMNFTGASTYTSLSGVRREMKWALPLEIGLGLCGFIMWVGSLFLP